MVSFSAWLADVDQALVFGRMATLPTRDNRSRYRVASMPPRQPVLRRKLDGALGVLRRQQQAVGSHLRGRPQAPISAIEMKSRRYLVRTATEHSRLARRNDLV
jgi:hypothetical protein